MYRVHYKLEKNAYFDEAKKGHFVKHNDGDVVFEMDSKEPLPEFMQKAYMELDHKNQILNIWFPMYACTDNPIIQSAANKGLQNPLPEFITSIEQLKKYWLLEEERIQSETEKAVELCEQAAQKDIKMFRQEVERIKQSSDCSFKLDYRYPCITARSTEVDIRIPQQVYEAFPSVRIKPNGPVWQELKSLCDTLNKTIRHNIQNAKIKEEEERQRKEAAKKAVKEKELAWIAEYGSDRLKGLVQLKMEYRKTYEEERLEFFNTVLNEMGYRFELFIGDVNSRANATAEEVLLLKKLIEIFKNDPQIEEISLGWIDNNNYEDEDEPSGYSVITFNVEWHRYIICAREI